MVRTPLTAAEKERGAELGRALRTARGARSAAEVARRAGVCLDTLRKIERGAIASPAFYTVAAIASVLDIDIRTLAENCRSVETGILLPARNDHAIT